MKKTFIFFLIFVSFSVMVIAKDLTIEKIFSGEIIPESQISSIYWLTNYKIIYLKEDMTTHISSLYLMNLRTGEEELLLNGKEIAGKRELTFQQREINERFRVKKRGVLNFQVFKGKKKILIPSEGNIYIFDLKTKKLDLFYSEKSPAIDPKLSPDNKYVSYVKDNDLYLKEIKNGKEIRLTKRENQNIKNGLGEFVALEEMGRSTAYWWSPDSTKIVYLKIDEADVKEYPLLYYKDENSAYPELYREKYPAAGTPNAKVEINLIDIDSKGIKTVFKEDSDYYIPSLIWARDNIIFFQKQDRRQKLLELYSYNIDTGKTKKLIEERSDTWVNLLGSPVVFSRVKRFFWLSERDGWAHLYLYDFNGKLIKKFLNGDFEIIALSKHYEKMGVIYFYSNKDNPMEKALYGLDYRKNIVSKITREKGSHTVSFSPNNRHYIDIITTMNYPYRVLYKKINGVILKTLQKSPDIVKDYNLSKPEIIKINTKDAVLYSYLLKPENFDPNKKYPLIVYIYGGPHSQNVSDSWKGDFYLFHQLLTKKGFLVYVLDNRGTGKRGKKFEDWIYGKLGEKELEDQIAGINYLIKKGFVDEKRIGIWGWSYGGFMTLYSLLKRPDIFSCGISVAPVTNWLYYDSHYTERYLDLPKLNMKGYIESSPLYFADKLKSKLFLVFGLYDDNVHPIHSIEFIKKLESKGIKFDTLIFPNRGHSIKGKSNRILLFNKMLEFWERNLKSSL